MYDMFKESVILKYFKEVLVYIHLKIVIRSMSTELKLPADRSVTIELLADLPLPAVTRK